MYRTRTSNQFDPSHREEHRACHNWSLMEIVFRKLERWVIIGGTRYCDICRRSVPLAQSFRVPDPTGRRRFLHLPKKSMNVLLDSSVQSPITAPGTLPLLPLEF